MGQRYHIWEAKVGRRAKKMHEVAELIRANRQHTLLESLEYGDHGLFQVADRVLKAIKNKCRIALYADYDVDGTMSAVSWIWFLQAIGYDNFVHYIPCRFTEGYGLNLDAMKHLIDVEGAEMVITMDTGITANAEAEYCKSRGVEFLCTDHHMVQASKMPDCIILNPKMHPDELYQELCGCGITFVLLRHIGRSLSVPRELWTDLLALSGMATICDIVPLNGVNHRLARLGVQALMRSQRPVLKALRQACSSVKGVDEKDVGYRLGPCINAVGRLDHADVVVEAFIGENPGPLVQFMHECNEKRKKIQEKIVREARVQALKYPNDPILFLGGDWHPGVVGIAASKIADEFWRPVWLFQRGEFTCKGSARSIPGFDVTNAMMQAEGLFDKFGGHKAAGGFTFLADKEEELRAALNAHGELMRKANPDIWVSRVSFDCELERDLLSMDLVETLDQLKPFGHGFEEPRFLIDVEIHSARFYTDKLTGEPRHTAVTVRAARGQLQKVMFFHQVHKDLLSASRARFVVSASRNRFRGEENLNLIASDFEL